MRSVISMASLLGLGLSGISALACPNLAGNWICKSDGGSTFTESVAQQAIPNGMLYTLTSGSGTEQLYVDGTAHPASMDGLTGTMTGNCADNKTINYSGDLTSADGSESVKMTGSVILQEDGTQVDSAQFVTTQGGQTSTTNGSGTCTRQ